MIFSEWSSEDLEIRDVDLKAEANTVYQSRIIDAREFWQLLITVTVAPQNGDGATGLVRVTWQPVDKENDNLGGKVTLADGINSKAAGTCRIALGGGYAAGVVGQAASIGANVDEHLRVLGRGKLALEVEEQSNDTGTNTGSLHLQMK